MRDVNLLTSTTVWTFCDVIPWYQPTAALVAKALPLDIDSITILTPITQAFMQACFATQHVSITCVLLTCLPCCSRLPLKEIACVTAVKARDLIAAKFRWLQLLTVFPLVSPKYQGVRVKTANKKILSDFSLYCLLLLDQHVDVKILYVYLYVCLCVCV